MESGKKYSGTATTFSRRAEFLSVWENALVRAAVVAALVMGAFLVGLALSWSSANGFRNERDSLLRRAEFTDMQLELATAALYAEEGRFEEARLNASSFYKKLRGELDSNDAPNDPGTREQMRNILSRRDEVIFLLGRGDGSAARILAESFLKLKGIEPPRAADLSSGA